MRWLQAILPKEERFFALFAEHARAVVAGAEALKSALAGGAALAPNLKTVMDCEHEGDRVTREAVPLLSTISKNIGPLNSLTEKIVRVESEADDIYDAARKRLFEERARTEPVDFWVAMEIMDHLEKVADSLDDVANEIHSIVTEHV